MKTWTPTPGPGATETPAKIQRIEFRAMGCHMMAAIDSDSPTAADLLAQVPGWFAEWERRLSRFREDSELVRLNHLAGAPVPVSSVLWEVVQTALQAAMDSDGLVTPTLLEALEAAGYDRSFEALLDNNGPSMARPMPPIRRKATPRATGDWRAIRVDARRRTIHLPSGMRLDLGGVAKGWAADRAARRLSTLAPALVDAGGDIAVSGPMSDGQKWPIGVVVPPVRGHGSSDGHEHSCVSPDSPSLPPLLMVARGGIATSGRDYRRWLKDGLWQHHILDPRTGRPADTDVVSATAVAPTARQAEVAAKVALVLGSKLGLAWIEARPGLAALLVLEDGRIVLSRQMRHYLWS